MGSIFNNLRRISFAGFDGSRPSQKFLDKSTARLKIRSCFTLICSPKSNRLRHRSYYAYDWYGVFYILSILSSFRNLQNKMTAIKRKTPVTIMKAIVTKSRLF